MADLHHGDCLEVMRTMPDCSFDAVVTDPPYGLSFMGKKWDYDVPSVAIWAECLRVLKPGGHLLAFAGTRTQHRMAVRIEDAGFEIRDMIAWVYGSGFPKSLDVSKAIDKAAGAERTERMKPKAGHENFVGRDNMKAMRNGTMSQAGGFARPWMHDPEAVERAHWDFAPATPEAQQWAGWGTALKPALEPITMARRPLDGTVAANVLEHGTGALNVDGCRVEGMPPSVPQPSFNSPTGRIYGMKAGEGRNGEMSQATGRWPANLIHDGSDEVVGLFPQTVSGGDFKQGMVQHSRTYNVAEGVETERVRDAYERDNGGSAARFFYTAPCLDSLITYLLKLITKPNGTVLTNCNKEKLPNDYNYIGQEL